jgi:hypothetical protein
MADRDRLAHLPDFPDLTVPRPAAMTPAAFAAILKAATTPTKIKTVVQLQATRAELFFLHTMTEPDALRIQLSRALVAVREAQALPAESGRAMSDVGDN